jgi:hypothetical protein
VILVSRFFSRPRGIPVQAKSTKGFSRTASQAAPLPLRVSGMTPAASVAAPYTPFYRRRFFIRALARDDAKATGASSRIPF